MNFGPVLAAAFVLWPVMAVLGGQGFAPVLGLTALAALAVARPRMPPTIFAILGFMFIAWAALGEILALDETTLLSGSLLEGNFALEARSISAILMALASTLTIAGALRASPSPRSIRIVAWMLSIQAALVIASPFVAAPVLQILYGDDIARQSEGLQNMGRSANVLALGLPLLLAILAGKGKLPAIALAIALLIGAGAVSFVAGNQSAVVAMLAMGGAVALVALFPRNGFRWLFGAIAGYIFSAPVLMALLIRFLDPIAQTLPASFRSRLFCWETVIGRIPEAPFFGHGLNATRFWRETYATQPQWLVQLPSHWKDYEIVPGHPHNMALQIWAETGMVGAVLAALSCVALSMHLPRPADLKPEIRFAISGVAGAALAIFSFSYSLWSQGFWSALALVVAAIVVWHRTLKDPAS